MGFWWIGRKSAPADARPFVPAWLTNESAEEGFARSYHAQFDEVYRRNPVGQRSVRLVAGMLGALTIDGDERAVALVTADGVLENITANLLLHGNAYVQLIADGRDAPQELCLLRPERVSVVSDEKGWPVGYLYRAAGQVTRVNRVDPLERRQVAHIKALHPRDDHYGMGCVEAAIAAASVHNRAAKWNKALLDNAARPSGALTYETADAAALSAEQFERLKEELRREFSGSGNAGRPLLLEGGLKWQPLSLTPADMDFVALKEGAARDIALAFGVPPVLVGLPGDATYANAREAGRALYRQTILPMAGRILNALGGMLSDWLGPVTLAVDADQISEIADDRAKLWEAVGGASFLSDEEKREMLGSGKLDGLSFDYRVREAKSGSGMRELVELDLVDALRLIDVPPWWIGSQVTARVVQAGPDAVTARTTIGPEALRPIRGSAVVLDGLQVLGARLPAIASPASGSTVDSEARSALEEVLRTLRSHGLIEI